MSKIEGGNIHVTKGTDYTIDLELFDHDGNAYEMGETEYLVLTVREKPQQDKPVLLRIESQAGSPAIVFTPSDTEGMAVGFYSADIWLMALTGKYQVYPDLEDSEYGRTNVNWKNFIVDPGVL